ncbi:MAG: chemotaxis protein CheW [Pseudobacteriovorax sp.]|nr:chemotaxis protein CheW [Pseudobacteriovorax sp.]
MDALALTSIDTLLKKALVELRSALANDSKGLADDADRALKVHTQIHETTELLKIVSTWLEKSHPDLIQAPCVDQSSDDLGDMSDEEILKGMEDSETSESLGSSPEELSDEDAAKMLAEMDEPAAVPPSVFEELSEELSDDEAARLLAEMDKPAVATEPESNELSDDEAAKLLAEMDKPAEAASSTSEELSDEEAARLLAEMDEPATAEDDANALLQKLGGAEESEQASKTELVPTTSEPAPSPVETSANDGKNPIEEIPEWEENDFQTDPEMINDFNSNSDEIMEKLDEMILRLEQEPTNKKVIEEIFRGAHTLKGAAGMFGFKALERVMHRMETLFDLVRKDQLIPDSNIIDVVFDGLDCLRTLLKAVKDGKPCGIPTADMVYALELAAEGKSFKKSSTPTVASQNNAEQTSSATATPPQAKPGASSKSSGDEKKAKKKEQSTIRVDLERLDVLVNLIGELVIDRTRFASIEEELRTNYPQVELGGSFSETVQLFGRHMNEIQDIIMKVRMVPIGNAFNKFTRIVRDLSRSLDKKIDLVISGETAELDKTLVEQIGDPLIHLIRNSCDHGVETPEIRTENGKSPTGTIILSAHQEGNHIVIKIEDDGKGIDPDIIRRKAIEKGLISEESVLDKRDILGLIFEPGFSTAEQVTNISGRGVGMDVVKKNIMKLKGMIELDSELGKGTTTTIRLPLTLAIVQSLLVRSKQEVFAIPLSSVIESIRILPEEIQKVGDAEVFKLRDRVLPLVHLDEALDLDSKEGTYAEHISKKKTQRRSRSKQERLFVVVVGHADRPTGIVVDQLLNQQEMVIKSMGGLMKNIPCVAGGAVLGHGEVVLVLDIPELEESTRSKRQIAA